ncbi:uncharacterized protein G2W53_004233 [Senna tora]|uniref:Uncharacterized protein n=1 Tax=Senna tora TaxID=362788 RepID=A0A835CJ58_9FABA|nr:uncharacterized protein G2W53_004233 [Senna tora]
MPCAWNSLPQEPRVQEQRTFKK